MKYERGGQVNGWILAALLAVGLASAAMNVYQAKHRVYTIVMPPASPVRHLGVVPKYAYNCEDAGVYCYLKI